MSFLSGKNVWAHMLDNAEYFTRTFIRGPICRGQITTDVICDRAHRHFWEILHDITAWQQEHQPLQTGIFDINRYKNL